MRDRVTFFASNVGVSALQRVPGLAVVKLADGLIPVHQFKFDAVVLQVAAHAVAAVGILHLQAGVISAPQTQETGDLFVTCEALERRLRGSKFMADGTLGCTVQ